VENVAAHRALIRNVGSVGAISLALLLLSGCSSTRHATPTAHPTTAVNASSATTTTSTTSTTDDFTFATPQQQAIASIAHQIGTDFLNATPPRISSESTYLQQWQAAQPLVNDTTRAEEVLNDTPWPADALGAKSRVLSDLEVIHSFVASAPQSSFPGPPSPSSHSLSEDFDSLNGNLGDLLQAVS